MNEQTIERITEEFTNLPVERTVWPAGFLAHGIARRGQRRIKSIVHTNDRTANVLQQLTGATSAQVIKEW